MPHTQARQRFAVRVVVASALCLALGVAGGSGRRLHHETPLLVGHEYPF